MEYKGRGVSGGMANESVCAEFPDTWEEFVDNYAYGIEEWNQEGLLQMKEVIDVYRAKQMMWYYLRDYLRLGVGHSSEDYVINVMENPVRQGGIPYFRIDRRNNGI